MKKDEMEEIISEPRSVMYFARMKEIAWDYETDRSCSSDHTQG